LQTLTQLEEDDSAVLELLANDAVGRPAQAVAVEGQRSLQIVDTQGDQCDPRFHQRRGRDSNPRGFRLPLFESGTINHSDTSPRLSLWAGFRRLGSADAGPPLPLRMGDRPRDAPDIDGGAGSARGAWRDHRSPRAGVRLGSRGDLPRRRRVAARVRPGRTARWLAPRAL